MKKEAKKERSNERDRLLQKENRREENDDGSFLSFLFFDQHVTTHTYILFVNILSHIYGFISGQIISSSFLPPWL